MNAFHYQNRELCVEDIPLARIAEQYGTPCYVYAESALTQAYSAYSNAFAGMPHLVCYALKANSNLSLLKLMREEFELCMALCGCPDLASINHERLWPAPHAEPRTPTHSG